MLGELDVGAEDLGDLSDAMCEELPARTARLEFDPSDLDPHMTLSRGGQSDGASARRHGHGGST